MDKIKLTTPLLHKFYDWAIAHEDKEVNHSCWSSCIVGQFHKYDNEVNHSNFIYGSVMDFLKVTQSFKLPAGFAHKFVDKEYDSKAIIELDTLFNFCNTYGQLKDYMLKYFEKA